MQFLRQLNLSKNPVSQESHYDFKSLRRYRVYVCWTIKKLPRKRAAANRMKRGKKKNKSGKKETKSNEDISECTRWLYRDIEKMKAREKEEEENSKNF